MQNFKYGTKAQNSCLQTKQAKNGMDKDASYIHKVESGKINISLKAILKICEVLHIEPVELFKSE